MAISQLSQPSEFPKRTVAEEQYIQQVDQFLYDMARLNTELAQVVAETNTTAEDSNEKAALIAQYKQSAEQALATANQILADVQQSRTTFNAEANDKLSQMQNLLDNVSLLSNYKGAWGDLSGALTVPSVVLHNNNYWQLVADLPDVVASEPGFTSPDWFLATSAPTSGGDIGDIVFSADDLEAKGGYLKCDGRAFLQSVYPQLFSVLGVGPAPLPTELTGTVPVYSGCDNIVCSPSGKFLLTFDRGSYKGNLHKVDLTTGNIEWSVELLASSAAPYFYDGAVSDEGHVFGGRGEAIKYNPVDGSVEVAKYNVDSTISEYFCRCSSDGKTVALRRGTNNITIYKSPDGISFTQIGSFTAYESERDPVMSPDGSRLSYVTTDSPRNIGVATITDNSVTTQTLTFPLKASNASIISATYHETNGDFHPVKYYDGSDYWCSIVDLTTKEVVADILLGPDVPNYTRTIERNGRYSVLVTSGSGLLQAYDQAGGVYPVYDFSSHLSIVNYYHYHAMGHYVELDDESLVYLWLDRDDEINIIKPQYPFNVNTEFAVPKSPGMPLGFSYGWKAKDVDAFVRCD